ncbi:NAD(P)/FAD-dependent oxidoreductase [Marinactinospora thermotolerans]|uniref:Sarcosine oxidase n=1 Tax=Marinactinospora thermotolerans DSM 45154 TaxID=1122192 RepID=A0A1T4R909_9ACTN|nr:FAD-dependent oxidoreductase [Marinactinospora thermotolerans]SKA12560.1 sarcosine oxidase [Marinactinospora thermotolerans DSM 45154]
MKGFRQRLDTVVIGAGVLGLATTDALRRRGVDVVCFDGRTPGQGQSGGRTRSFRHRHDDPRLVRMAADSLALWRRWEERSGRVLIGPEGTAYAGMSEADAEGLRIHDVRHEWVEPEKVTTVFGPLAPVSGPLLVDPTSGAIRTRSTIKALQGWVGDRIRRQDVHGVTIPDDGEGVELHTEDAIYRARHVVICAGTETPRLAAGVGLEIPLDQALHTRPHYRVREGYQATPIPCWVDRSGEFGETVYGSLIGGTDEFVVGLIGQGVDVDMNDGLPPGTEMESHVRRLTEYVERAMPGLVPEPVGIRVCVMTKLPGGSDAFGVWNVPGVTATTGHNLFKMAPLLGELLADSALNGRPSDELRDITASALVAG